MVRTSVATVRREIDRALAERRLDEPERFAQVQVARLIKALKLAEAAVELGELKVVATYLQIVARLTGIMSSERGKPSTRRPTHAPPPPARPAQGADFCPPPPTTSNPFWKRCASPQTRFNPESCARRELQENFLVSPTL